MRTASAKQSVKRIVLIKEGRLVERARKATRRLGSQRKR